MLLQYQVLAQDTTIRITKDAVTVTALKFPQYEKTIPFTTTKRVNNNWNMNVPSMAEVLSNSGTVLVQKSQGGGGSPIIRGFEASRVLLMVDGIRMNNAIYRAGHLQNIITVDPNALQQVDVLYGPASTQYGSDALGGVVAMYTKNPMVSTTGRTTLKGTVQSRYSSALNEQQLHAHIAVGGKQWAFMGSFTNSLFGDVVQGNSRKAAYPEFGKKNFYVNTVSGNDFMVPNPNPNKQISSGYTQYDAVAKLVYKPSTNQSHMLNVQYSTTTNVPRYDRLTELAGTIPRFAEWYYGPQKRLLLAHHYDATFSNKYFSQVKSIAAFQSIEESRYDRRFNNKNRNNRIENVKVISYTLDGQHIEKNGESHVGIDVQVNDVRSTAFTQNIITGTKLNNINTRYPDGDNSMVSVAAYYQQLYHISKQLHVNAGLRLTQVHLSANFVDKTVTQFPFDAVKQTNAALSGNLGITYNTLNNVKLSALVSTGFRAPNVEDLGKVFDSRAGAVVVPNPNLEPEYTYNGEVNVSKKSSNFELGLVGFYTLFRNAIVVNPFTYNGASNIVYQNVNSAVLASQNVNKAYIYGASINAAYTIASNTTLSTVHTYTYGRVRNPTTPLDHIPPMYGRLGIKHTQAKWSAEAFMLYNSAKKLKDYSSSGEDNLQYATPDGMPSWSSINLHTHYNLAPSIALLIGIDNVLDANYRVFASGISAPGRNVIVSLKASF